MMKKKEISFNASPSILDYYGTKESKWGYKIFLSNTRHFGYYRAGTIWPFPIHRALRAMEEKLFNSLSLSRGARVLDAGAGVANVATYMAQQGLKVEAIDLVVRHIEIAKDNIKNQGLADSIRIQKMNYQNLTFDPETFDGVYTVETFVHSTNPEKTLAEFYRVLKPGGKLALFEYDRAEDKVISKDARVAFQQVNYYASMPTFQRFTYGVPEQMLKDAGFTNVKVVDMTDNILPMLRLFFVTAFIPYQFIKLFKLQSKFVNTMSAVEYYKHRRYLRYIAITADKPNRS